MKLPEADWSHSPEDHDTDGGWEKIDKNVASLAFRLLDMLSQDLAPLEVDAHGWTEADRQAFGLAQEMDYLARMVVPPETASVEHRVDYMATIAGFRTALPFAEAERRWLFDEDCDIPVELSASHDEAWFESARRQEEELVSAGVVRVVRGRDLLQRWWSWRRETGEYAGQGSLNQARSALKGVIGLMAPELGLPETYEALRGGEN
jgi:hypothetical protein